MGGPCCHRHFLETQADSGALINAGVKEKGAKWERRRGLIFVSLAASLSLWETFLFFSQEMRAEQEMKGRNFLSPVPIFTSLPPTCSSLFSANSEIRDASQFPDLEKILRFLVPLTYFFLPNDLGLWRSLCLTG